MKKTIRDIDFTGKKVIVRVDFNVPLDDKLQITDETRIRETLPTINYLREQKAKIILMSHLGRPKEGEILEKFSLKPVAKRLRELLNTEIKFAPGRIDKETFEMVDSLKEGEILLLDNLRFNAGEKKNDPGFANQLASMADIFVEDAFGSVHRAHASTVGITSYLPAVCGFLLEKEIKYLSKVIENPDRPFIIILGGAKVHDKIGVIKNLMNKVDGMVIGGAMAYTFLKSKGINIGGSLVENDKIEIALDIIEECNEKKIKLLLPIDHLIVEKISPDSQSFETSNINIPDNWIGVDIGSKTILNVADVIRGAKTIFWNGPMGIFEMDKFATGTIEIAKLIAEETKKGATSIIGGGDTVAAVQKAGRTNEMSHISTGGGASLEFLEGKTLPGIDVLPDKGSMSYR